MIINIKATVFKTTYLSLIQSGLYLFLITAKSFIVSLGLAVEVTKVVQNFHLFIQGIFW